MKTWMLRATLGALAIVVLGIAASATYEAICRSKAARDYPPPGKMVEVGDGRRIQFDCRGSGLPIVVFESGLDTFGALAWEKVHDEIAATTEACAYSRAGIMWSDPRKGPATGDAVAADLHEALSAAGKRPPYVLVGHSLGTAFALIYTQKFPTEVAGLTLIEGPNDADRLFALTPKLNQTTRLPQDRRLDFLNRTGLPRIFTGGGATGAVNAYSGTSFHGLITELESMPQVLQEAESAHDLGDRPLVVLTALATLGEQERIIIGLTPEQMKQFATLWKVLGEAQASWSSRGQHQFVDSGHYVQFDHPDIVIAAVRSVVTAVRGDAQ